MLSKWNRTSAAGISSEIFSTSFWLQFTIFWMTTSIQLSLLYSFSQWNFLSFEGKLECSLSVTWHHNDPNAIDMLTFRSEGIIRSQMVVLNTEYPIFIFILCFTVASAVTNTGNSGFTISAFLFLYSTFFFPFLMASSLSFLVFVDWSRITYNQTKVHKEPQDNLK
jgi:hypothetical protein